MILSATQIGQHLWLTLIWHIAALAAIARRSGALLAVGHCSGAGLLHGVLVGFAIAHSRVAHQVLPLSAAAA